MPLSIGLWIGQGVISSFKGPVKFCLYLSVFTKPRIIHNAEKNLTYHVCARGSLLESAILCVYIIRYSPLPAHDTQIVSLYNSFNPPKVFLR